MVQPQYRARSRSSSRTERGVADRPSIGQAKIAAPIKTQNGSGFVGFAFANFQAAVRRRFAIRQIEDANARALSLEKEDSAAGPKLGVVGMRGDDEVIEIRHRSNRRRARFLPLEAGIELDLRLFYCLQPLKQSLFR